MAVSLTRQMADRGLRLQDRELAARAAVLLSHELGGPISVLSGYAALWSEGELGGDLDSETPLAQRAQPETAVLVRALGELLDAVRGDPSDLAAPVYEFESQTLPALERLGSSLESWLSENGNQAPTALSLSVQTCLAKLRMVAGLIEQLSLAVGTSEIGSADRARTDLKPWLRRLVHTIAGSVAATGHRLIVGGSSGPVQMSIFPSLLEAGILNLLDNAQKFSPAGTPIVLAVRRRRGWGVIQVSDRGPGLPPTIHPEMFGRIDQLASFQAPGLGLGLIIAARVAALHGGELWCHDRQGGGTTFEIALPEGPR
jgi:signal transduction histidine kinase